MRRRTLLVLGLALAGALVGATGAWAQWPRELEGISRLHVIVQDLDPLAKELALTKPDLERLVSAFLRGKLPDVTQEMGTEYMLVTVRLSRGEGAAQARGPVVAAVSVRVYRPVVTLYKVRELVQKPVQTPAQALPSYLMNLVLAAVWQREALLTGDDRGIAGRLTTTLETLLGEFVADYYRANPAPPPPPGSR
ncbi:MAG: hypothetical protein HY726_20270 [Candidatus Rokubacteria bacterium]|nr:hypothetical protein [Candidatus Rokubacteria bacterium]